MNCRLTTAKTVWNKKTKKINKNKIRFNLSKKVQILHKVHQDCMLPQYLLFGYISRTNVENTEEIGINGEKTVNHPLYTFVVTNNLQNIRILVKCLNGAFQSMNYI